MRSLQNAYSTHRQSVTFYCILEQWARKLDNEMEMSNDVITVMEMSGNNMSSIMSSGNSHVRS